MATPEEAIRTFLDHLMVERAVSRHTTSAYRRDLARYAGYLSDRGVTDLEEVTPVRIADYAASLRAGVRGRNGGWKEAPLAPASVARAVVALRSLHRFAQAEGMTADDPANTVSPPRPPRRLPKALSIAQVEALIAAPGEDTALALRDTALLELLYSTGVRISEAVQLDVDDVWKALRTLEGQTTTITVLGKGSKQRVVPLGSYARSAIDRYLVRARPGLAARGSGTAALLLNARGGRLSRHSAWTVLQASAAKAGIKTAISPHTLRHSFATHLLDGGADVRVVQELLGHASVTTTQVYTLVTVEKLREVWATSHPRALI